MPGKVYLECTEGGSAKFWEIDVKGKKTTVKYGKKGTAGTTQVKTHATVAAANKFQEQQVKAKKKKGYAEPGENSAEEDEEEEAPAPKKGKKAAKQTGPTTMSAPTLWECPVESTGFGVFVDDHKCLYGDEGGNVVELDHSGKIRKKYKIPSGVKCIVGDGDFLYVGNNQGALYDLSQGVPRLMCEIENFNQIYWMDVYQGVLAASDSSGNVAMINCEGEIIWKKHSDNASSGWMARMDDTGIYHGHSSGVTKYSLQNGKKLWHNGTASGVMFGVQTENAVYSASSPGVTKLDKAKGKLLKTYSSSSSPSNAVGGGYVFKKGSGVEVYDEKTGAHVYNLDDVHSSGMSMQFHNGRLYVIGSSNFVSIDMSDAALKNAEKGKTPKVKVSKADGSVQQVAVSESVEATSDASGGIIVQCIKEGKKVRVRPVSAGYNNSWNVQFPRAIRKEGKKFVVDELRVSDAGGFYRAFGDIKELQS